MASLLCSAQFYVHEHKKDKESMSRISNRSVNWPEILRSRKFSFVLVPKYALIRAAMLPYVGTIELMKSQGGGNSENEMKEERRQ